MTVIDLVEKIQSLLNKYEQDRKDREIRDVPVLLSYTVESTAYFTFSITKTKSVSGIDPRGIVFFGTSFASSLDVSRVVADIINVYHLYDWNGFIILFNEVRQMPEIDGWKSLIFFQIVSQEVYDRDNIYPTAA